MSPSASSDVLVLNNRIDQCLVSRPFSFYLLPGFLFMHRSRLYAAYTYSSWFDLLWTKKNVHTSRRRKKMLRRSFAYTHPAHFCSGADVLPPSTRNVKCRFSRGRRRLPSNGHFIDRPPLPPYIFPSPYIILFLAASAHTLCVCVLEEKSMYTLHSHMSVKNI